MHTFIRPASVLLASLLVAVPSFPLSSQESSRRRGEQPAQASPAHPIPPSIMTSLREQIDPYQAQKLQILLTKPEVQAELEIDAGTFGLVAKALTDVTKRSAEVFKGVDPTSPTNRQEMQARLEEFRKLQDERAKATDAALTEIFPPEKYERLKQIALRIQIQEAGLGNVLLYGILAEELQFSDAQFNEIAEKAEKYDLERQARIREINAEFDAKLLGNLSPKQRKFFEQQVGENFEYNPKSRDAQSFDRFRSYRQRAAPPTPSATPER